jgi:opacity protein-like surface antigen
MQMGFKSFLLFSLLILSSFFSSAQDTTKPFTMSIHAYDSVLRALKHADSLKKKQDTGTKEDDSFGPGLQYHGHDSADKVISPNKNTTPIDTILKNTPNSGGRDTSKGIPQSMIEQIKPITGGVPGVYSDVPDKSKKRKHKQSQTDSTMARHKVVAPDTNHPKSAMDERMQRRDSAHKAYVESRHEKPHKPRSGYIALQYGLSSPVSDYANLGYASSGQDLAIDIEVPGRKSRLEWAFKFAMGWNGVNTSAALQNDAVQVYSPGTVYTINTPAHGYTWHTELVGPCFSIPGKKLSFDIKMLFGILTGTMPAMSFNAKDTLGNAITVNQYSATGHGFAFDFGLGVHYRFSHHITATLSFDYLTSKPSFSLSSAGITQTYDGIRLVPVQTNDVKQSFSSNMLNIGVGYSLGN